MALLLISWFAATRAGVVISSIVWIIIGFMLFREYEEVLLLGLVYMIAFAQFFIPLNKVKG